MTTTTDATVPTANATAMQAVTAYLCVRDARAALDWYAEVFGARLTGEPIIMDDGRLGHADFEIGGAALMIADEFPEIGVVSPLTYEGTSISFVVNVPDADATYALAVERGASGGAEPSDQFYGARAGWFTDPFGHRWSVSTPLPGGAVTPAPSDGLPDVPAIDVTRGGAAPARPVGELGYFTLTVPDIPRAVRFYSELFGWAFDPANTQPDGNTYAHVSNTNLPFGLHDNASDSSPHHFYRVADIEAMIARVRELGGEVLSVETYNSGGNARCRDDQGVEFDLWEPAPGY